MTPLECKLCGLKKKGSTKMFPCDECKINFPSAKRCSSCGRIFPHSDKFKLGSPYCISCDVRKMKKKIAHLRGKSAKQLEDKLVDHRSDEIEDISADVEDDIVKETELKKKRRKPIVRGSFCKKKAPQTNLSDSDTQEEEEPEEKEYEKRGKKRGSSPIKREKKSKKKKFIIPSPALSDDSDIDSGLLVKIDGKVLGTIPLCLRN